VRDLGKMGESVFSQLCASAGLTANSSDVDKTGWDFFVEFGFDEKPISKISTIHDAAYECKVQVKATDSRKRKIQIKLSNLKRLATTSSPAFFFFIEFDGEDSPQRIFLVHLDTDLISKILSRLHDADIAGENDTLHKKTMTIFYDDSHQLNVVSGHSLSTAIKNWIGANMAGYVEEKNFSLKSIGFNSGFADISILSVGYENISKLIDMSIGIADEAEIAEMLGYTKRFGKSSLIPFVDEKNLKLSMPELKPKAEGILKIKLEKTGTSLSLPAKLYVSPFNSGVPVEMRKSRFAGDFFNFIFNPFTNECTFRFEFSEKSYEINNLRLNLIFLQKISVRDQILYVEFISDQYPPLPFQIKSPGQVFNFTNEISAVDSGNRILSKLNIFNPIKISLPELSKYAASIIEMDLILSDTPKSYKIDIPEEGNSIPIEKEIACISFFTTSIGDICIGVFAVVIGKCFGVKEGFYNLFSTDLIIEKTLVQERNFKIARDDIIAEAKIITNKYSDDYFVIRRFLDTDF